MGIFGSIMDKIFHHQAKAATPPRGTPPVKPAASSPAPTISAAPASTLATASATSPAPAVDVGAVLASMAEMKDGGGNYQSSIVDLLKLLGLDSSLSARKELGQELGVHIGADGSAEQNIALHKAVMEKLAENGGLVPDSLRN